MESWNDRLETPPAAEDDTLYRPHPLLAHSLGTIRLVPKRAAWCVVAFEFPPRPTAAGTPFPERVAILTGSHYLYHDMQSSQRAEDWRYLLKNILRVEQITVVGMQGYQLVTNWIEPEGEVYIDYRDQLQFPCEVCKRTSCALTKAHLAYRRIAKRSKMPVSWTHRNE